MSIRFIAFAALLPAAVPVSAVTLSSTAYCAAPAGHTTVDDFDVGAVAA